jgi:thiol-disulfide isomerase/thioredoxin
MNVEILERLIIAAALGGLGVTVYLLFNRMTLKRAESKVTRFQSYRPGLPALVYFTTPTCAPCKTVQRPAIERIKGKMGAWFQVIEVDASATPEVAQEWGVMSVPTTFIIDANGKPRYVNHGVTNAETLIQQLELEDFSI